MHLLPHSTTKKKSPEVFEKAEYYTDILCQASLTPEDCLMVGNDVDDDMPAQNTGMKVFLLTDCLINRKEKDISSFERGNFEKLKEYIKKLVENPQKM